MVAVSLKKMAVMVMVLNQLLREILSTDQVSVPLALPWSPLEYAQVTLLTLSLSEAVPDRLR